MIKIEIYGEDPAKIKQQMLELFNIEPNNTIAIHVQRDAGPIEVTTALLKEPGTPKAAKPPKAPQDATPAKVDPVTPPWTEPGTQAAVEAPEAIHVQPELAPQPEEVPVPPAMKSKKMPPSASELRELLGKVSDKCGSDALNQILAAFKVKQFSKINPEDYPAVEFEAKMRLEAQA
jgi:hypothetical protein